MAKTVKLSVVGFGISEVPIDLDGTSQATVADVLNSFQASSNYPFLIDVEPSPFRKGVNLVFSLSYKGVELASILAQSPGQEERVWQFYVTDENGLRIPNNSGEGRRPFDRFVVEDGYHVTWRLVVVIKQPIALAKRVRNGTTPGQADAMHRAVSLV